MKLFQKSLCASLIFTMALLSFNTHGVFSLSKKISKCWQNECLNLENKIGPDFYVSPLTGRLFSHTDGVASNSCSKVTSKPSWMLSASEKEVLASGWKAQSTFGNNESIIKLQHFSVWADVRTLNNLVADDEQTTAFFSVLERYSSQNIFVPIHPPQTIYSF
jgi:hypothetical protein